MNKKLFAKLLAVTVAASVSASLFVGCKKTTPSTETTTADTTAAAAGDTTAAPQVEPGWKKDAGEKVTLDWYLNFNWFPNKWGVDDTSKYITEKTGVTENLIVPAGNENEKLNTMIASNSLPDVVTLGWWEEGVKKMEENGLVYALDDLANQYDPYFNTVANKAKLEWYKRDDGHTYGYPNASSSPEDFERYQALKPSNQTFLVRKDLYEGIGSPNMRTPDGFLKALADAKAKYPTLDGQPIIPFAGMPFGSDGSNDTFVSYLGNFLALPRETDGKIYDEYSDPNWITWMKTFRKANEQGLLSKDIFIDQRPQMEEKLVQGRYFSLMYQRSDFAAQQLTRYQKDPNSIYEAIDGPANDKMDAPKLSGDGISGWTLSMITKNCKNPKRAIEFLSYLISEEGNKDLYLGREGFTYEMKDGKPAFVADAQKLLDSDRSAFDKKYGASYTFWQLMDTTLSLQWAPPTAPALKQMEDWTKGKSTFYAYMDNINPPVDSTEGEINSKIGEAFNKMLPKLFMAKDDAEFDKLLNDFKAARDAAGWDKLKAVQEANIAKNKAKLGMK